MSQSPSDELQLMQQDLTVTNVSSLALNAHISLEYPFQLKTEDNQYMSAMVRFVFIITCSTALAISPFPF